MKKLLIAASLSAAAFAAAPLLAQTGEKPAETDRKPTETAAKEGCAMGEHGARAARQAEMHARMQEMHARMGMREGRGPRGGTQDEHQH